MTADDDGPYGAHRFRVTCDVLPNVGFTEVRGLSVAVASAEVDNTVNGQRNSPGVQHSRETKSVVPPPDRRETQSPTLELTRGVTDEQALWEWFQKWVADEVDPQDVRICLLDTVGDPVRGWVCKSATPVRWTGPDLVADRAMVATESLELTHEGIDVIQNLEECIDGDE